MGSYSENAGLREAAPFLCRLAHDASGNTLALLAAGLFPLLALVGGGVDMGRNYLAQSRLQQACDAGVLAARKKLGSEVVTSGTIPAEVETTGNRFFNLNFRTGAYGTNSRTFQMILEPDYAITGEAAVKVPTTIMNLFGYDKTELAVSCQAKLNFSNTDVLFVLDTTGSMAETNPGDSAPRIDVLRAVVKDFHAQLEGSKTNSTRLRYGFLPYSTNVNVGGLLKPDWMVDEWNYQGRVLHDTGRTTLDQVGKNTSTYVSGTNTEGTPFISTTCPENAVTVTDVRSWTDPNGTKNREVIRNGTAYDCDWADSTNRRVTPRVYVDHRMIYSVRQDSNRQVPVMTWRYKSIPVDVSRIKNNGNNRVKGTDRIIIPDMAGTPMDPAPFNAWFRGCIEERDTYEITDYSNVDFARALDLDIDRVPSPGNPATQWRPILNEISFVRALDATGAGSFVPTPGYSDSDTSYLSSFLGGLSSCPAPASPLAQMTAAQVDEYLSSLTPEGSTYHDIGMIWGARMLSPTGIFADENADHAGKPTNRNLIFLTDGETAPLDLAYGAYGIEPLDGRRWKPGSSQSLVKVVEGRFAVACEEAKKRNIKVWVIGFGINLNPVLTTCAGPGRAFEAADARELQTVFSTIAAQLGDLRVTK